jgi:hypothetical protein
MRLLFEDVGVVSVVKTWRECRIADSGWRGAWNWFVLWWYR